MRTKIHPRLVFSSRASGGDFRAALSFAAAHHFDGIDWNLDYFRIAAASNARKLFTEAVLNSGLPARFHAPCQDVEIGHANPLYAEAALIYLKMYIDFVKVFPETHLNLHIGSRSIPETELSWETALHHLKELVRYGRECGVTICLENLKKGWTSDPERLAALAAASGAMVTLDIGHARAFLKAAQLSVSLEQYIQPFAHRIRNLHLYEIETVAGRHQEPENLEAIGPILNWALEHEIQWWVLELSDFDEALRTKRLLEAAYLAERPAEIAHQKILKRIN
jgi:sugar phosphate isomerase/epimerase